MKNISIKWISILTVIIISCYVLSSLVITIPVVPAAEAAGIDNEDVYKGIGIAIVLYLLATSLQDNDTECIEERDEVDEEIDHNQEDTNLLSRIIYAESRGEPYEGQVAVGAVVLNRVKHPDFPNTIAGVIYQDGQFTSVENGQFQLTPGVNAYNAAYDALAGVDPSNGALYFYNPEKAETLWWLSSREKTAVIGDHVFAK